MSTSNKTPSSAIAKTASAPKFWALASAGLLAAALLLVVAGASLWRRVPKSVTLQTPRATYYLQVAADQTAQQKGLGGRISLPTNSGMLFWFSGQQQRCFWMKDMQFPLDIIWLDGNKRVVHEERDLSPATYPHTYCPPEPARYVLELNAGQAQRAGIVPDEALTF